jgi:8-oxo-dGTP pyrophosphatase MutT (NUDIX family)
MDHRAAIILLQGDKIALIERHRAGLHYFVFPGGHIEPGETPEQAAVRETMEELGLQVVIRKLAVVADWQGRTQYYFLAELLGGSFGTGTGEEMITPRPEKGSYQPLWMPIAELSSQPIKPFFMADLVTRYTKEGWPEKPVAFSE